MKLGNSNTTLVKVKFLLMVSSCFAFVEFKYNTC